MSKNTGPRRAGVLAAVVIAVLVGWWLAQRDTPVATTPVPPPATQPTAAAPAAPEEAQAKVESTEPAIQHPVPEPSDEAPALESDGIAGALGDWLGRRDADAFLQTGDFARRFVATVDNLGRSYAPASLWPVNPAVGRFAVQAQDGQTVIAPDNAGRYAPLVALAEAVDVRQAVALYVRLYPRLQSAYEDIGFPGAHFNDRLIQVIDLLLASPEPEGPIAVHLVEVKGPEPSLRPWVRYEFADPALQGLSAGQKIMVRVGADNQRRLKARLAALRQVLLAPTASR